MKKISLLFVILIITANVCYSADKVVITDTATTTSEIKTATSWVMYLTENIGKDAVVYISNVDINLFGKILYVYDDSIVIQTALKKVIIPKTSIAFIEFKK